MNCDLKLVRHGTILVVLGLLSGFATAFVAAPNMALAAHSIGVIQGTLAIGLAFLWPVLAARGKALTRTRVILLVGFYCNWLGALLAGVWSAKMMAFVTGAAMPDVATRWQEIVVAVLLNASILVLVAFAHLAYVVSKLIGSATRARGARPRAGPLTS